MQESTAMQILTLAENKHNNNACEQCWDLDDHYTTIFTIVSVSEIISQSTASKIMSKI